MNNKSHFIKERYGMNFRVCFAYCCLTAVLLFASACKKAAPPKTLPPAVLAEAVAEVDFADSITEIGVVEPMESVDLVASVSGFLTEVNFKEGQPVRKGTKLFQIDPAVYDAAVKKAEADLNKAKAEEINSQTEFDRQKTLLQKDATAKRHYDTAVMRLRTAQAEVKSAEAVLAQKKVDLGYTRIMAPFDGNISFKKYSVGNMVGPESGVLARIVTHGKVKIYFSVDELSLQKFLRNFPKGKDGRRPRNPQIRIFLQDGTEYKTTASIAAWNNMVQDGTFRMQAIAEDPQNLLVPGLYIKVKVQTSDQRKYLMIHAESIMREQLGNFVYVVNKDSKIERRKIKLGPQNGSRMIVEEGLKAGEMVVTEGLQKVRPGSTVRIVASADAAIKGTLPANQQK